MKIKEKVIIAFKSIPENFVKEKSGKKSNTIRDLSNTDDRFENIDRATHIRILNAQTGEQFERKITDITYWYGRYIISWNPNEKQKGK